MINQIHFGLFTNLSIFIHAFLGEIQTELHTNKVVWIKQRQVIVMHPICPFASIDVKRINMAGIFLLIRFFYWVYSRALCLQKSVPCKWVYMQSHRTAGSTTDEYKLWGGF